MSKIDRVTKSTRIIIYATFLLLCCKENNFEDIVDTQAKNGMSELPWSKEVLLKTGNDFIGGIDQIKLVNDYILVVDRFLGQQVYLFKATGSLISKVGKKGHGPGEYIDPLAGEIVDGKIYIASGGTNRMEVFNLAGAYIRSFPLTELGVGVWHNMIVDTQKTIYLLNLTRYSPFSIHVFDTLGNKISDLSKVVDTDFGKVFDTFYPAGAFAINKKNNTIYQVFNHRYEIKVMNTNGNIQKILPLSSPFYRPPNYEKAKNVRGHQNEKKFRSSFTQVSDLQLIEPNILALVLTNWKTQKDFEHIIEFWDMQGTFVMRHKVEENEKLLAVYHNKLVFRKEGSIDKTGIPQNPSLIFRRFPVNKLTQNK